VGWAHFFYQKEGKTFDCHVEPRSLSPAGSKKKKKKKQGSSAFIAGGRKNRGPTKPSAMAKSQGKGGGEENHPVGTGVKKEEKKKRKGK